MLFSLSDPSKENKMSTDNFQTNDIRVLIVDDEERARELLEILLLRLHGVSVCGKAASADEALDLVMTTRPDLVFLDVQMPEKNGFQLVGYLQKYMVDIPVVFVTAHTEFAIPALKVSAFDYLLKPVIMEQLEETIHRFRAERIKHFRELKQKRETGPDGKKARLKFNTRTGYLLVNPMDIIYCEAEVNYTTFHLGSDNREVVTINLGRVEEMLASWPFCRISRSVLINTTYLKKADRQKKKCLLEKGAEKIWLDIPPNQIRELENKIENSM
jgi:DNA-binding LytR/AlgR family response regulator